MKIKDTDQPCMGRDLWPQLALAQNWSRMPPGTLAGPALSSWSGARPMVFQKAQEGGRVWGALASLGLWVLGTLPPL